ncbi:uncharacterized protein LOC135812175 isoform X2 [Sycon ciliatum]|uniref:uncharacterized protein LOC135812175 isoform X2 n=1 Tax=Sycon ciliatum TaxID=27933 RepID=UPI0031F6839F
MDWPGQHVTTPYSHPVKTQQQHTQPTEPMMARPSSTRNPLDLIVSESFVRNVLEDSDIVFPFLDSFNSMHHSNQLNGCSKRLQGYGEQQSHPTWSSTSQAPTVSQYFADTRNLPAETGDHQTPMDWPGQQWQHVPTPHSLPVQTQQQHTQPTEHMMAQSSFTRNPRDAIMSGSSAGNALGETGLDLVYPVQGSFNSMYHSNQLNGCSKRLQGYGEQQSHPTWSSTSQAPTVPQYAAYTRNLPAETGDYQTPMDTSRSYYHSPYSFPVKKKGRYTQATVPTTSQSKITRNAHAVSASLDGNASGKTSSDAVGCSAASVIPISHSHQANGSSKHPEGNYREQQSCLPWSSTNHTPAASQYAADTRTLPTDLRDYETPMVRPGQHVPNPHNHTVEPQQRHTQATVPTKALSKNADYPHAVPASLAGNASRTTSSDAVGRRAASAISVSHSHQSNGSSKHPEGNYREQQSHPPLSSTSQAPVVSQYAADTQTLPTDLRSVKLERNAKGTDLALRRRRQNNIAAARHRLKKKRIVEGYIQIIERLSAEILELRWTVLHQQKEIADLSAQKLGMHIYPK